VNTKFKKDQEVYYMDGPKLCSSKIVMVRSAGVLRDSEGNETIDLKYWVNGAERIADQDFFASAEDVWTMLQDKIERRV
jgi:hypothetical protein